MYKGRTVEVHWPSLHLPLSRNNGLHCPRKTNIFILTLLVGFSDKIIDNAARTGKSIKMLLIGKSGSTYIDKDLNQRAEFSETSRDYRELQYKKKKYLKNRGRGATFLRYLPENASFILI